MDTFQENVAKTTDESKSEVSQFPNFARLSSLCVPFPSGWLVFL